MSRDLGFNLRLFGNQGLITESPGRVTTDIFGLETCTAVYKCPADRRGLVPAMFSQHPIFTYLNLERRTVDIQPGFLVITADYAGVPQESRHIFELSFATAEISIQQHPKFVTDIAGKPSAPLNGAVFVDENGLLTTDDSKGVFDKFRATISGAKNEFAGITAYLAPGATAREIWIAGTRASTAGVGHISGAPFAAPPGTNWLFMGASSQQRGIVFSNTYEWRSSEGGKQWNPIIYG